MCSLSGMGRQALGSREHRARSASPGGGRALLIVAMVAVLGNSSHAQGYEPRHHGSKPTRDDTVGSATSEADGSIVLTLRATGWGSLIGDARIRYTPADPNYGMIARHVGPIAPGASVPVRPFDAR